jgi:hypothetical protein
MRLLIVGGDYTWSIERHYLKYLQKINPDIRLFAAQNRLFDYLNKSIFNKINHRLGISDIYRDINAVLWQEIEEFNPDCIWVFKGMQVSPETLVKARQKGIKLANYNPDNPFIFTGRGSGNKFVSQSIGLYDLHFTYNLEIQKQLAELTTKPVEFLPFGYDLLNIDLNHISNFPEIIKPCFLGNPDKERAKFIRKLNKQGIQLDLYGNGWNKFVSSSQNKLYDAVYGIDFYIIMRQYRVQLNIMRIHNLQSHNMRTFEIPAVGGIQLAPDTPEHRSFFEEGREIFLYNNLEDCVENIKEILKLSTDHAKALRKSATTKMENSSYSYKDRAFFAFQKLELL